MVETLQPHHLKGMALQKAQAEFAELLEDDEYIERLCKSGGVAVVIGGKVMCCGGVMKIWAGRGFAWSLLSVDAGRHMLEITRAARDVFASSGCRRIEATCGVDFVQAHRWLRILGFECEAPVMKHYGDKGEDESLYARIK